jgi:hypothetical protein
MNRAMINQIILVVAFAQYFHYLQFRFVNTIPSRPLLSVDNHGAV